MSIPVVDSANLPAIPLWARQWIYLLFLLALLVANSIDAFYETGDPWWLPGALRVLNVVGLFVTAVALVNARPSPAEHAQAVAEATPEPLRSGELGHPLNLQRPQVPDRIDDDLPDH